MPPAHTGLSGSFCVFLGFFKTRLRICPCKFVQVTDHPLPTVTLSDTTLFGRSSAEFRIACPNFFEEAKRGSDARLTAAGSTERQTNTNTINTDPARKQEQGPAGRT